MVKMNFLVFILQKVDPKAADSTGKIKPSIYYNGELLSTEQLHQLKTNQIKGVNVLDTKGNQVINIVFSGSKTISQLMLHQ